MRLPQQAAGALRKRRSHPPGCGGGKVFCEQSVLGHKVFVLSLLPGDLTAAALKVASSLARQRWGDRCAQGRRRERLGPVAR